MNVIFLTNKYRDLIRQSKWDMSILHPNLRRNHLSISDIRNIESITDILCKVGNPLYKLGFKNENEVCSSGDATVLGNSRPVDEVDAYKDLLDLPLGAYCLDEETIVLWVNDDSDQIHHDAIVAKSITKTSIEKTYVVILNAMARVMRKHDIIKHKMFEDAYMSSAFN